MTSYGRRFLHRFSTAKGRCRVDSSRSSRFSGSIAASLECLRMYSYALVDVRVRGSYDVRESSSASLFYRHFGGVIVNNTSVYCQFVRQ